MRHYQFHLLNSKWFHLNNCFTVLLPASHHLTTPHIFRGAQTGNKLEQTDQTVCKVVKTISI